MCVCVCVYVCVYVYVCMCVCVLCMCVLDLGMSLNSPCHTYGTWACSEEPVYKSRVSPADRFDIQHSLKSVCWILSFMSYVQ